MRPLLILALLFSAFVYAEPVPTPARETVKSILETVGEQGYVIVISESKGGLDDALEIKASVKLEQYQTQIAKNPWANFLALRSVLEAAEKARTDLLNGRRPEDLPEEDLAIYSGLMAAAKVGEFKAADLKKVSKLNAAELKSFATSVVDMQIAATILASQGVTIKVEVVEGKIALSVASEKRLQGLALLQRDKFVEAVDVIKKNRALPLFMEPQLVQTITDLLRKL